MPAFSFGAGGAAAPLPRLNRRTRGNVIPIPRTEGIPEWRGLAAGTVNR
jgi:hypothetical protein